MKTSSATLILMPVVSKDDIYSPVYNVYQFVLDANESWEQWRVDPAGARPTRMALRPHSCTSASANCAVSGNRGAQWTSLGTTIGQAKPPPPPNSRTVSAAITARSADR